MQVAAKTYYFGVGGGVHSFRAAVAADGALCAETVLQIDDGASNMREIIELRWHEEGSTLPASSTP